MFSEKVGERVDADPGEARREEAEVHRGERRVPQGTQKGTVKLAIVGSLEIVWGNNRKRKVAL